MTGQEDRFWLVWCISCLWRVSPLTPIDRGYLSINIISGEEVAIKPFPLLLSLPLPPPPNTHSGRVHTRERRSHACS